MSGCRGKAFFLGWMVLAACLPAAGQGAIPEFDFEVWGRTVYGDGYVYGPPYRATGMTVVDYDADGDYDFVMPSLIGKPQVMRNLGNNRAFYPGGPRELDLPEPGTGWFQGRYLDFADVDGSGLPDAVVVARNYDTNRSAIFWYRNAGPRDNPHFVSPTLLYQSPQSGGAIGAVDVTDLDGDNLFDIAFVEFTMIPADEPPRLFFMRNIGDADTPQWAAPQDIVPLSDLLPGPREALKSELGKQSPWLHPKERASRVEKSIQKASFVDVVTDMEFGDWDNDGDLDCMFYDSEVGVHWVECLDPGLPVADPGRWDTVLDRFVIPYTQADIFQHVQGAFAVRPGPDGLPYFEDIPFEIGNNTTSIVVPGATGIRPGGVAVADFNMSGDGVKEVIAAYTWTGPMFDEGRVAYLAQNYGSAPSTLMNWQAPIFLDLLDANGDSVNYLIESISASDVDRDGRPDLVATLSTNYNYRNCTYHVWRNTPFTNHFEFIYLGEIAAPQDADPHWGRLTTFADIDTDGDDDLFIAHQYTDPEEPNPEFNRYPYFHYYRNGADTGLGYWQTRVVANQSWTFSVGNQPATFDYVFNGSGGSISNGVYTAGPNGQTVDIIQTNNTNPNYRIFIDVLPAVGAESKAIFVIGGAATDPLYPAFTRLAQDAYEALTLQGIDKDNIRVYASGDFDADDDGNSDRYARSTIPNIQAAVTTWAADANRLLVYFIDHGQRDRFRVNEFDYLDAGTYASWINDLQAAHPALAVTTVLDMCEAGSFVDDLELAAGMRKAGARRITIAGSGQGPTQGVALFDATRSVSFSLSFWEEIWNGATYGEAFSTAKVAIESINPLQAPQIDDNGNGIANEAGDGLLADMSRPGADFDQPPPGVYIGEVAESQVITTDTAMLWLSDVVAGFPVEAAGALIVPPNLQRSVGTGDDEQPLSGLVWVDFTYSAPRNRWEASYSGFTTGGLYRIQYYVSTLGRWHASPRIGSVDRTVIPDAWEDDDLRANARWIPLNTVQGHNFHDSGDVDWIWVRSPAGAACTVAVLPQGPRCQPTVRLFKAADLDADPNAPPVELHTAPAPGRDVVFDHSFAESEPYLIRVNNGIDPGIDPGTGEGTSYLVVVAAGSGGIIPPVVIVVVKEQGTAKAIANAVVNGSGSGNNFSGKTTVSGEANFVCTFGDTYSFTAAAAGYRNATRSVRVNNQTEVLQIQLVKDSVTPVTLTVNAGAGATPKVTLDGAEFDTPQTFTLPAGSSHTVAVPLALSGGLYWDKWSDGSTATTRTVNLGSANLTLTAHYKNTPRTDINEDMRFDALDVQLVINAVLGLAAGNVDCDASGDGRIDAIDVQQVINAVLGLG